MRFLRTKLLPLFALMLCMSVFSMTAYASDGEETLTVNAAWVDGELLRINVTDAEGVSSALALRLSDYVNDAENEEYISIQAIDLLGNKSGVIEIKNPYYVPVEKSGTETPTAKPNEPPVSSVSSVESENKPFTPVGTGTVMENATDGDGKEFFTIDTEDGGVFYLIVDRQRNDDNVYLLNSVTLDDLVALADKNGQTINTGNNGGTSAIQTPGEQNTMEGQTPPPNSTDSPEQQTDTSEKPAVKNDNTMYILIGIIVVVVGGIGYYFKIVKGKKNNVDDDGDDEDEYGYEDESDDSDDTEDGDEK